MIDLKIIPEGGDAPADEDEESPKPFAVAEGVDEHPDLKRENGQQQRAAEQIVDVSE